MELNKSTIFKFTKVFKNEVIKFSQNKPSLKEKINNCIIDFQENGFNSRFYRKKLKGFKQEIHELEIGGDYRIIIQLLIKDNICYFLNFGTHSSLELSSNKSIKINIIRD